MDMLLIVGSVLAVVGTIVGGLSYYTYAVGNEAHIANLAYDTVYIPEKAPGDAGYKDAAAFGFAVAGIGLVLCVMSPFVALVCELFTPRKESDSTKGDKG
jgi:hypothetical protein